MITGTTPVNKGQAEALKQQQIEASAQIKQAYGRAPITFDVLLNEVNVAGWPSDVEVHPLDFFFLTGMVAQVHKDTVGPYFYLSASRIRPAKGTDETLDLTNWAPSQIVSFGG